MQYTLIAALVIFLLILLSINRRFQLIERDMRIGVANNKYLLHQIIDKFPHLNTKIDIMTDIAKDLQDEMTDLQDKVDVMQLQVTTLLAEKDATIEALKVHEKGLEELLAQASPVSRTQLENFLANIKAIKADVQSTIPPIETPPVETPPVETPPVEIPPVETPTTDPTPPVEETPVEDVPPVEETPAEEDPFATPVKDF